MYRLTLWTENSVCVPHSLGKEIQPVEGKAVPWGHWDVPCTAVLLGWGRLGSGGELLRLNGGIWVSTGGLQERIWDWWQSVIAGILWIEEIVSFRKYNFLKVRYSGENLSHWDLYVCLSPVEKCDRECLSWGITRPDMPLRVFGVPVVWLSLGNYIPGILLWVQ